MSSSQDAVVDHAVHITTSHIRLMAQYYIIACNICWVDVTHNVTDTLSFDDKDYYVHPGTWQFDLSCCDDRRLAVEKTNVFIYRGCGGCSGGIVISALGCLWVEWTTFAFVWTSYATCLLSLVAPLLVSRPLTAWPQLYDFPHNMTSMIRPLTHLLQHGVNNMTSHTTCYNILYNVTWLITWPLTHDLTHNMTSHTTWPLTQHDLSHMTSHATWPLTQHDLSRNMTSHRQSIFIQ